MTIGIDYFVATIVGEIDYDSNRVMVRDAYNVESEVDASYLPKGSGVPQTGERWMVDKKYGKWVLGTKIGTEPPATISGDWSTDSSAIISQVIAALEARGILVNGTANDTYVADPVLDDTTDPMTDDIPDGFTDEFTDDTAGDDSNFDPTPDALDTASDHGHENIKPEPTGKFSNLTITSYNEFFGLGIQRVQADWRHLRETRSDIIGWQEADNPGRDSFYDGLAASNEWGLYRPGGEGTYALVGTSPRECPIAWRLSELKLLASDYVHLAPDEPPGYPARWGVRCRFLHLASGMRFTVINTHLETQAVRYGYFNPNPPSSAMRVTHYQQCLDTLVSMIEESSVHGPVFLIGDFNYHWERAIKLGPLPGTPWARFKALGMSSNYLTLGFPNQKTHKGSGWIDYQWFWIDAVGGIKLTYQKVLTPTLYYSDHNPLMCTYRIRNRTTIKQKQKKPKPSKPSGRRSKK